MPIRDKEKARKYKRQWIANKRKQNVEPVVEPYVEPMNNFVEPVEPKVIVEPAPAVEPERVEPAKNVEPCLRNHYSLTELFHQASEQVQSAWTEISSQNGAEQCYNCHNSQSNHQLAINLLERYWAESKRLERGEKSM